MVRFHRGTLPIPSQIHTKKKDSIKEVTLTERFSKFQSTRDNTKASRLPILTRSNTSSPQSKRKRGNKMSDLNAFGGGGSSRHGEIRIIIKREKKEDRKGEEAQRHDKQENNKPSLLPKR